MAIETGTVKDKVPILGRSFATHFAWKRTNLDSGNVRHDRGVLHVIVA